jgi:hypothetical protein
MRYKRDEKGIVHPWGRPQLTIDPARCPYLCRSLPRLRRSETKVEDVAQTPKQDDHAADALRYLAQMWMPEVAGEPEVIPEGVPPGMIPGTNERRSHVRDPETIMREDMISLETRGLIRGGRWQRPLSRLNYSLFDSGCDWLAELAGAREAPTQLEQTQVATVVARAEVQFRSLVASLVGMDELVEEAVQLGAVEPSTPDHDAPDPGRLGYVLKRIAVQEYQVRSAAGGHRPDRVRPVEDVSGEAAGS